MRSLRLLVPGPEGRPRWVRLYIQPIGGEWVAMIVAEDENPPAAGHLKGTIFFGRTAEEAERHALVYFGAGVAQN